MFTLNPPVLIAANSQTKGMCMSISLFGYVLLAVARRTREMGVLRALGLQRSQVAATFAVEQAVGVVVEQVGVECLEREQPARCGAASGRGG